LKLVAEDADAFNAIMDAYAMPKVSDQEKMIRTDAIQAATKHAIEVPFEVMQAAFRSMDVIQAMAMFGNPNSLSDAGVGALCARAAVYGAYLNVKINAKGLNGKAFAEEILSKAATLLQQAHVKEVEILRLVESKI
jgi:glutamate formiminotransferase/formiminotetrahydrofolate cyclodeaminase